MLYTKFHNGINIGGWLSQYEFLAEQPLTEASLERHFTSFITETDISQIADWGFDHVRLPVSGYLLFDPKTLQIKDNVLSYIDTCVSWCKKHHLNLILDLHDLWGNIYGAMDVPMPLLTDKELQKNFFSIWEQLTEHFQDIANTDAGNIVLMFELLNEVSDATGYLWNRMYKEAIKRIRMIDEKRPILVGSNCQNSVAYLNQLYLIEDPFVFYNFHYYDPQVFTHQKAHFSEEMKEYNQTVTYPGDISDFVQYLKKHPKYQIKYSLVASETNNDRELMIRLLKNAINFTQYSGRQLYCGEFGVIDSAPPAEAVKWINDLISILDTNKIGHALWNYKALDFGLLTLNREIVSEKLLKAVISNNHI
ncbi:MAG: cellulase family glycosylhydrolase [Eubacteriales bacterium]|nr:cellulase family glycosylhydrolase [Eubacteriales bacterium]